MLSAHGLGVLLEDALHPLRGVGVGVGVEHRHIALGGEAGREAVLPRLRKARGLHLVLAPLPQGSAELPEVPFTEIPGGVAGRAQGLRG